MQKEEIQKLIDDSLKETMLFSTTKYGDTPTDALQLANRKYVDSRTYTGYINANGTAGFLPNGWTSSKSATGTYVITHNFGNKNYTAQVTTEVSTDTSFNLTFPVVLAYTNNFFTINTIYIPTPTDRDMPFFFTVTKNS